VATWRYNLMSMAPLHPERRQRGYLPALLAATTLLALVIGHAANADRGDIQISGNNLKGNINAGTQSMDDFVLKQGSNLINAKKSSGSGLADGRANSTWDLKGEVHIEFDGAVLDADAATVKFVDSRIRTIHVNGAPARFSQPLKTGDRVVKGRAAIIDYDAATSLVQFSGGTQFDYVGNQITTDKLTYNMNDSSISPSQNRSQGIIQPGARVPAPKVPDRKTAQ
jgi:lipopolysaccharide transport protein LptA